MLKINLNIDLFNKIICKKKKKLQYINSKKIIGLIEAEHYWGLIIN